VNLGAELMGILLGVVMTSLLRFFLGSYGVTAGRFVPLSVIQDYDMSFHVTPRRLLLSALGWAIGPVAVGILLLRQVLPTWTDYFGIQRVEGWASLVMYVSALLSIWLGLVVKHGKRRALPADLRMAIQEVAERQGVEVDAFTTFYSAPGDEDIRKERATLLLEEAKDQGLLTLEELPAGADARTLECVMSALAARFAQILAPDDHEALTAAHTYSRKSYELVKRWLLL